jgi:hypothetical protein
MMIFAMDIIGDRPADGDEAGSGRNGEKPAPRKKYVDNIGETDSTFAAHHAAGLLKPENSIQPATIDQLAAVIQTGVAVTAAKAVGQERSGCGIRQNFRYLVVPRRPMNMAVSSLWVTSPREKLFRRHGA